MLFDLIKIIGMFNIIRSGAKADNFGYRAGVNNVYIV